MLKAFLILMLTTATLFAQSGGTGVVATDGPPRDWHTKVYTSTTTGLYICYTKQDSNQTTITSITPTAGATTTLTFSSPHGFHLKSTPTITISGMTGSWAPLNGTWIFTPTSATTGTIAVNSAGFGSVTGTLTVVTRAPRLTQNIWGIKVLITNASTGLPEFEGWAVNGFSNQCTNVAELSYQ